MLRHSAYDSLGTEDPPLNGCSKAFSAQARAGLPAVTAMTPAKWVAPVDATQLVVQNNDSIIIGFGRSSYPPLRK
jgi:hypothetical protein